jgi:glycosyltransferase involved in cell wall biosynthesis
LLVSYCGDDILGDASGDGSVPASSRVRSALIRAHASLCAATITKSQEMHDRLPARIRRKNTVLPNGVDTALFRPVPAAAARERLGWSPNERVALFAATKPDSPNKRRWLAEAACAVAAERVGPVRLHVAGETPPDEMPLLMSAADCLIHTAAVEGSPNVVKEALACNLPVVATPSGDIPALLHGVSPSFLCDADADVLGDALVRFFSAPTRSNGRARIEADLSADAVAARLLALYSQLGAVSGDSGLHPSR